MTIKIEIEATSVEELRSLVSDALGLPYRGVVSAADPDAGVTEAPTPKAKPRGRPKAKPEPVAEPETEVSEPEPEVSETTADVVPLKPEAAAEAEPEVNVIHIRDALNKFMETNGLPAARKLLAKYGAEQVSKIPEEKRAEVLAALQAGA